MIQLKDITGSTVFISDQEIMGALSRGGLTIYGMSLRAIELLRREYVRHTGRSDITVNSLLAELEPWPASRSTWAKEAQDQAQWEINLEKFEAAVAKEKARLRNKKPWFPWRINITKL